MINQQTLFIHDVLNEAHQNRRNLRSCRAALREELAVGAVDDLLRDGPLHRVLGIAADPIRIPPRVKYVLNFDVEKRTKLFSKFQQFRINHQCAIRQNIDLFYGWL